MELIDINFKIKEIQNLDITGEIITKLLDLIYMKIIKITGEEDMRQFSSIVKELKLNKRDEETLINLRNSVMHSFLERETLKKYEEWIKYTLIPAVLAYPKGKKIHIFKEYEGNVSNKLFNFGEANGFDVFRELKATFGSKRTRLIADLVFIKNSKRIIFEIKYGAPSRIISIGIRQLMTYLLAFNSDLGVLIIPGKVIYEEIREENFKILVIGDEANLNALINWIGKYL